MPGRDVGCGVPEAILGRSPGPLAQLGERRLDKPEVTGSSPVRPIPGSAMHCDARSCKPRTRAPNARPCIGVHSTFPMHFRCTLARCIGCGRFTPGCRASPSGRRAGRAHLVLEVLRLLSGGLGLLLCPLRQLERRIGKKGRPYRNSQIRNRRYVPGTQAHGAYDPSRRRPVPSKPRLSRRWWPPTRTPRLAHSTRSTPRSQRCPMQTPPMHRIPPPDSDA
jgi:hypothetical protein